MTPADICRSYSGPVLIRRWAATWLDLLFFAAVFCALWALFGDEQVGYAFGLWGILLLLYYPLFEGLAGRTIGKLICGLKVVNARGHNPGVLKAILRTLVRLFEVNPFLFGGLPAGIAFFSSKTRQRMGDVAADTFVLRTEDLPLLGVPTASIPPVAPAPMYQSPPMFSDEFLLESPPPQATPVLSAPPLNSNILLQRRPPEPAARALPGAGLFTALAIAFIGGGFYTAERERSIHHPVNMTCQKFLESPRKEGWYHLTGCDLNITEAAYETLQFKDLETDSESSSSNVAATASTTPLITDIYVPAHAPSQQPSKKTPLLVRTNDEKVRRVIQELARLETADEKKIVDYVQSHMKELEIHRDVTGMVEPASDLSEAIHTKVVGQSDGHLTDNFVVLLEGNSPTAHGPILATTAGVLFALLAAGFGIAAFVRFLTQPR